jgi:hypothetical protein
LSCSCKSTHGKCLQWLRPDPTPPTAPPARPPRLDLNYLRHPTGGGDPFAIYKRETLIHTPPPKPYTPPSPLLPAGSLPLFSHSPPPLPCLSALHSILSRCSSPKISEVPTVLVSSSTAWCWCQRCPLLQDRRSTLLQDSGDSPMSLRSGRCPKSPRSSGRHLRPQDPVRPSLLLLQPPGVRSGEVSAGSNEAGVGGWPRSRRRPLLLEDLATLL